MRATQPCSFRGCIHVVGVGGAKGLCQGHYRQSKKGIELRPLIRRRPRAAEPHPTDVDAFLIPLNGGHFATVSVTDADLARHIWTRLNAGKGKPAYAYRRAGPPRRKAILLHREIAARAGIVSDEREVDHRDGDGLNCRRVNLRPANDFQNAQNQRVRRDSTTGVKGVAWDARNQKWRVTITANKKTHRLGRFSRLEDAKAAYAAAARRFHGEFARTE